MKHEEKFSDEYLNAFIDGQLTPEERAQIYEAIHIDNALNRRVCELCKLHDLVQMSYEGVPAMSSDSAVHHVSLFNRRSRATGIAAGLALVLGVLIGWGITGGTKPNNADLMTKQNQSAVPSAGFVPVAMNRREFLRGKSLADNKFQIKVLIHINTGNPSEFKDGLNEVSGLLQHYKDKNIRARVEVVANGESLHMLRSGYSPFAAEIKYLQSQYKNLRFVACKNSIDRLAREKGIVAQLLPGVVVIDSGVAQIMRRQHQGWAYIQV